MRTLVIHVPAGSCKACFNGSYTMMAKPVKILELDYPMIQFLVNSNIHCCSLLAELLFLFCFFTYNTEW